ncbi:hypothetical protein MAM1_0089d04826 [Mucor ambiguus]|uniref:Amino acid permease/ SLC12A domain-containing protein n=1 Tax=Mucor ambiguus TaxID=91626 RepID=A0A0C9M6D4_9FUNG|nr:hypothetical protein MAM1_0089d04826 [Mucor ambiguus]
MSSSSSNYIDATIITEDELDHIIAVISAIVGMYVYIGAGGGPTKVSPTYYWEGGAFLNHLIGVFSAFIAIAFSFNRDGFVSIAAGKSANPQKTVPASVKHVLYHIILAYNTSILNISLVIPNHHPSNIPTSSSFPIWSVHYCQVFSA